MDTEIANANLQQEKHKLEEELHNAIQVLKIRETDIEDKDEKILQLIHNVQVTSAKNKEYEEKLRILSQQTLRHTTETMHLKEDSTKCLQVKEDIS